MLQAFVTEQLRKLRNNLAIALSGARIGEEFIVLLRAMELTDAEHLRRTGVACSKLRDEMARRRTTALD